MTRLLVVLAAALCAVVSFASQDADLSAVVTDRGLQTVSAILLRMLRKEATRASGSVRDVSFSGSRSANLGLCRASFSYGLKEGNLESLHITSARLSNSHTSNSIDTETTANAVFKGKVHWRAKCGRCIRLFRRKKCVTLINVDDSIRFTLSISGAQFKVGASPSTSGGLPSARISTCQATLSNVRLRFSGGLSRVYNTIARIDPVERKIKKELQDQLKSRACRLLNQETAKINGQLRGIPLSTNLPPVQGKNLGTLEYRFADNGISVTRGMVALKVQGAVVPSGMNYDQVVGQLTSQGNMDMSKVNTQRDVTLLLDNTLLNSALFAATRAGALSHIIPSSQLPSEVSSGSDARLLVSLVCPSLPGDVPLAISVRAHPAPTILFEEDGARISLTALLEVKNADTNEALLSLTAENSVTVEIDINNNLQLTFTVSELQQELRLDACFGDEVTALFDMIKPLIGQQITRLLNGIGARGFRLPRMPDVQLREAEISFASNTLAISTNVHVDV